MCLRTGLHLLFLVFLVPVFIAAVADSARVRHHSGGKQGPKHFKNYGIGNHVRRNASESSNFGMWPSVFNLATKAVIEVNATCGEGGREEFCRMLEGGKGRCGVCDNFSSDPGKRHPIGYAIDGTNKWWQSPALHYGPEFEHVTITVDLKQVYQIAYVIIKAANSPRPGTWILERSLDNDYYEPWQYFARNDLECQERFGLPATKGKPHYSTDSEVICTTFYSRLTPMENGEIHTSLVHGRPGANETSPELLEFTKARYVRLRLMGLRGTVEPLPRWFSQDAFRDKRLYYTIRDISIGGQCVCNGHAQSCRHNVASGHPECECGHHTCGPNCEKCCSMYNQRKWGPGSSRDARQCLPCNCHGHATSCHYDEDIDKAGLSMDIHGNYQGGGVCDNCTDYTTGNNCEQCMPGFYRPFGTFRDADKPCVKCNCDPAGSEGTCVQEGETAGMCDCLPGFSGARCDSCDAGYRGYPRCEACPCDYKGIMQMGDCEGECICKANVEGKYCDRCKSGYFALRSDNPDGCSTCFCSGVTTLCEPAAVTPKTVETLNDWLITDLNVSEVARPTWDEKGLFSIGNYELSGIESLYWLAPEPYRGNKLAFYSSSLTFKVHWVKMRGDTSGKPTTGPNLVIIGKNGMKIAHGNDFFTTSNMTFRINLQERDFYHIPSKVRDIVTRLKRTEYKGDPVTRPQFLSVLTDIKHVLLRATFHTDQIEALLEQATLTSGNGDESEYGNVERCSCPSGYSGLSCESCSFGYVRIIAGDRPGQQQGFCGKCDCNGHSETCNPDTGECFCQHNTVGETCERCAPGFYGNPLTGTPEDCKKCACPLENDENNFSPSCQLDYLAETEDRGYVCTQCPKGFTGDHCEICDDGYFGDPMAIGNGCKICDCNGGPCDRMTGQCLSCKGNTEGWRCDRCKSGHYGDASAANCKSCQCDVIGSTSRDCDNETGQCSCQDRFTGKTCDKCETGYGNVTALCTPCACNPVGAKSDICDPHTGLCDCHQGVEGFHCDACQNLHYGFSEEGCKACNCDPKGSQFPTCELTTGQCRCRPHYAGLKCDRCEEGHWKDGFVCKPCNCNGNGSLTSSCDQETGSCSCKPGVGGPDCSTCLPNYFGNITKGCKECEPCNKEGHICHPENGKCVCPPLTIGRKCEKCTKNAWGYEPGIGCKACDCSSTGSTNSQCDRVSGRCTCKIGFEGEKCDRCSHGYYGYKNCRQCNCNQAGTLSEDCSHDTCRCTEDGCRCKANVRGKFCDTCKEGTFGVDADNSAGCTDCFCFGRSRKCTAAGHTWDQIRTDEVIQDLCVNNAPCWKLPPKFTGDLTSSYGGYLRISSNSPMSFNYRVHLTGNGITLESREHESDVKIREANWRLRRDTHPPKLPPECSFALTRDCLMVVLQNVTSIKIEPGPTFKATEFNEILLDKARNIPGSLQTLTIERCECPKEYTSLSCQDPNVGYYRYIPKEGEITDSYIDKIVGIARLCHCNGRSNVCDPQTGHCQNCTNFTSGPHCEFCDEGYYKDIRGDCAPCLCPTAERNFAKSCVPGFTPNQFKCECKPGYSGPKCNKCEDSYYGDPQEDGLCQPCNCNPFGSDSLNCDKRSGICSCNPGFTGKRCSECVSPREVIQNGVCTPCDECTQILFNTIDSLWDGLNGTLDLFKDGLGPPWPVLNETLVRYSLLSSKFNSNLAEANKLINEANLPHLEKRVKRIEKSLNRTNQELARQTKSIDRIVTESKNITAEVEVLRSNIEDIIKDLDGTANSQVDVAKALREARLIFQQIETLATQIATPDEYQELFDRCQNVYDEIQEIYRNGGEASEIKAGLKKLKTRLGDMNLLLDQTELINKLAKTKNKQNTKRIAALKNKIADVDEQNYIINQDLMELVKKINATTDVLGEIERIYEILAASDVEGAKEDLENQLDETPDLEELLEKVGKHVKDLQEKVKDYKNLFNFTNEEWKKINASGAYENILKGIDDANNEANEAKRIMEETLQLLYPDGDDSLTDKTNLATAFSDRIRQRIINLEEPTKEFKRIMDDLEKLKYDILQNGKNNNNLTTVLQNMNRQIKKQSEHIDDLEKVKADARNVSNIMTSLEQKVNNLNMTAQYEVIKTYNKYLNLTTGDEIRKLMDKIALTRLDLKKIDVNFTNFDVIKNTNDEKFQNKNKNLDAIAKKMEELRNKLQYAKEAAHSINVAMSISNCRRKYRLQADVFSKLVVSFKCKTCTLFKLTNALGQFVGVTVENGDVTLNWKGVERRIAVSPDATATVVLEKIGTSVKMSVEQNSATLPARPIYDKDLFKFDNNDQFQIGELSRENAGDACIHKLTLNDQAAGFWNFAETHGDCPGCQKDPGAPAQFVLFNGNGYRNVTGARTMNPRKVDLQFTITTFDENSLIFLAQDKEDLCSYISLVLKDGHLELEVNHVDGTKVTLTSQEKYNNGRETRVNIALLYNPNFTEQVYSLSQGQPGQELQKITKTEPLKSSSVFKIKKSEIFIGGIPSTVNSSCIPVNTTSFLGYLNPDTEYSDPVKTISYNTKLQNGELQFTKAWFSGRGFLELVPEEEYKPPLTISFLLRHSNPNGFVMSLNNFADILIKNDKLVLKLGKNQHTLDGNLNKDVNFVEISLDPSHINASVNDFATSIPQTSSLPKKLRLHLGSDRKKEYPNYSGGISNIVINNKTVMFNVQTVKRFSKVEIGRGRPMVSPTLSVKSSLGSSLETNNIKEMQNTEGCPLLANYETDPDAVKFGDKPNSFIFIQNQFWKKDYVIELQFRTFYPNGLLFLAVGAHQQKHYNVLEIQEGKIRLRMKGRKLKAITFPNKVNDGVWHHVQIKQTGVKKKRKLTMALDGDAKKPMRMPKNNAKGELYVGGIPEDLLQNMDLRNQLHPFRGCVRSLKINNILQTLVKNKKTVSYNNIGQCFPNIEKGAYFGGDAYAIYKDDFKVNKVLELSFEFRTVEQNGILLSVSNSGNSPALSVELQNGAVVMTIDMGNGAISNVTNSLDSDFTLCNNRWHNIRALYSSSELTVNVDGIRKSWVQHDVNSLMDEIEAPLYVGGLPDNAPSGTLKIKENFKGCIRKLNIDDSLMDWTDMKELDNVLLNSCPVVNA